MARSSRRSKTVKSGIQLRNISTEFAMPVEIQKMPPKPMDTQLDSPFLTKLPVEVRISIYKYAIASWGWSTNTLHIVTNSQVTLPTATPWEEPESESFLDLKLTNTPCASALGDPFLITGTHYGAWPKGHLSCCRIANWRLDNLHTMEAPHLIQDSGAIKAEGGEFTRLGFMLCCQRIYTEMSYLLYSSLEFNFLDIHCARRFLTTIQQHHFEMIRSVSLNWRVKPSDENDDDDTTPPKSSPERYDWRFLCNMLRQMPALTKLHIAIYDCQFNKKICDDLDALSEISVHGGSFIIELPSLEDWDPEHEAFESGAGAWESTLVAPFVIQRRLPLVEGNVPLGAATHAHGSRRCYWVFVVLLSPCFVVFFCWFLLLYIGKCILDCVKRIRR